MNLSLLQLVLQEGHLHNLSVIANLNSPKTLGSSAAVDGAMPSLGAQLRDSFSIRLDNTWKEPSVGITRRTVILDRPSKNMNEPEKNYICISPEDKQFKMD